MTALYLPVKASATAKDVLAAGRAVDRNPTPGQIDAGTYRKGHVFIHGLDITIENPKGSTRSGTSPDGKKWTSTMYADYGYIRRCAQVSGSERRAPIGKDGDCIDVFIGPKPSNTVVFVVDQQDPDTGLFDEVKCVIGCETEDEARALYLSNYDKGWKGLKDIRMLSLGEFKSWLASGDTKKPIASLFTKYAADSRVSHADLPGNSGDRPAGRPKAAHKLNVDISRAEADAFSADPGSSKTFPDRGLAYPVFFRNSLYRPPSLAKEARFVEIPQPSPGVFLEMFALGRNFKIGGVIVKPVPVDVVDDFGSFKRASQDALHDNSMFESLFPFIVNQSIRRTVVRKVSNMASAARSSHGSSPFNESKGMLGHGGAGVNTKQASEGMSENGWHAVDLDGTLAEYDGWVNSEHIGRPIKAMADKVRKWLDDGKDVRIMSTRGGNGGKARKVIQDWTYALFGKRLPVTDRKDKYMIQLWDDRAVGVKKNLGVKKSDASDFSERLLDFPVRAKSSGVMKMTTRALWRPVKRANQQDLYQAAMAADTPEEIAALSTYGIHPAEQMLQLRPLSEIIQDRRLDRAGNRALWGAGLGSLASLFVARPGAGPGERLLTGAGLGALGAGALSYARSGQKFNEAVEKARQIQRMRVGV